MMRLKTSTAKRFTAILLALLLLVCNMDLGLGMHAYAAETVSKTDGGIVAENYDLTEPEKDLLGSGMLAGNSYSYSAISGGAGLVTVDTDVKKITAKAEGDWKAVRAEIIVSGSVKETVTLTDGSGKYSYSGNAFSVKVTYELKKEIAAATQETLLNTAGWLKQGIVNTDAVSEQSGNLYIMEQAMPELVNFAKNGIETSLGTVSFSDELTAIVLDLDEQMKANGGKFNLSVMIEKYDSGKKTEYLLKNGAAMKTELSNFITQISELQVALNTMVDNLSMFVENGWVSADLANQLKTVAGVCSKLINGLSAVNSDPWTAAQKGTALVSSKVDYAKLDDLVAALGAITAAPKVKNPLVLDSAVVQANLSMHNVTVQVVLKTVENKTDSNKLVVYASTDPVKLTIAEEATAAEIKQAVANAGIEADAKAAWSGVYSADHFATSTTTLPASLMEDIEYTITYTPKEYTVSYGYTTSAPTKVYYGYKMTLPAHADPEKAYDYKVNSTDHAQGEVITITENTKITRSAGKAYSGTNLYTVVADNYGNDVTQAILKSGALKQTKAKSGAVPGNQNIRVRKPDPADASSLLVLKDGKLTASTYDADYEGLSWVPYTYGAEGDENKFSGNSANWTGESAKVKYILYLTNFSKSEVQSVLDLAVTLKNDADKQKIGRASCRERV